MAQLNLGKVKGDKGDIGLQGPIGLTGDVGPTGADSTVAGPQGIAGIISDVTTVTGVAGTAASVVLGGTASNRTISLTIPRGDKGDTGNLPNFYATTTLEAPNTYIGSDGAYKRSNDPLNASTRKVGTAVGNLVERGTDGYPVNNNALGVGQTWQDLTASRVANTTYTNTTGRSIYVAVSCTPAYAEQNVLTCKINGSLTIIIGATLQGAYTKQLAGSCVIPVGASYSITTVNFTTGAMNGNTLISWWELK